MLPETMSRRTFLRGLGLCGAGLAVAGLPLTAAAGPRPDPAQLHDESRLLMDTIVRITVSRTSRTQAQHGMGLAFQEMERLIALFDRHQPGTVIATLNERQSLDDAPAEFVHLVNRAADFHLLTGGAFDATVQPLLELLQRQANPAGKLSVSRTEMAEALALVGMDMVRTDRLRISFARAGMGLTLDGVAKGYIVDRAGAVLRENGLRHFVINAGGDILCGGQKRARADWTVAIEDPAKQGRYPAVLTISEGAVATSGVYERSFDQDRQHSHLLSPTTGQSPRECLSVTVKAPTTMQADALATALSVMSRPEGLALIERLDGCDCLYVLRDGSRAASTGWKSV